MEKLIDIFKSIIGILIILSFVMAFSSCEKKSNETTTGQDTIVKRDTIVKDTSSTDWKSKMEEEGRNMQVRFDSLKAKAKRKGPKAEKEFNEAMDKINRERKELSSGNTDEKAKEKWEKFKDRTKAAVDSLEKKF